jgi:hypothetical protein
MMSESYFPPLAFSDRPDLHAFIENWYASHLQALGEAAIYHPTSKRHSEVYRFLWLRTFHHPLIFRLDVAPDLTGIVSYKEAGGAGGYAPGDLVEEESKLVSQALVSEFSAALNELGFWQMPSSQAHGGCDGSEWVLEAFQSDKYHVVSRWCGGDLRELALMLVGFSGHQVLPDY